MGKQRLKWGVAVSAAVVLLAGSASAQSRSSTACIKQAGFIGGPYVPDAETAKSIFILVERAIFPEADTARFKVVKAEDVGDHWVVFRTSPPPPPPPPDTVIVSTGGGQLTMDINKCDGTVSRAYLMR